MNDPKMCRACRQAVPSAARFCPDCGKPVLQEPRETERAREILNLRILYVMVGAAIPTAETAPPQSTPGDPPAYLGMHFILSPPQPEAVVSRVLQTVELVTLAIAGMYLAWWFRDKPAGRSR